MIKWIYGKNGNEYVKGLSAINMEKVFSIDFHSDVIYFYYDTETCTSFAVKPDKKLETKEITELFFKWLESEYESVVDISEFVKYLNQWGTEVSGS